MTALFLAAALVALATPALANCSATWTIDPTADKPIGDPSSSCDQTLDGGPGPDDLFGGIGVNVFYGGRGGDTIYSEQAVGNTYVYRAVTDSQPGTDRKGTPLFDRIMQFHASDVFDVSDICLSLCSGPEYSALPVRGGIPERIYFYTLHDGPYGTSTAVCIAPCVPPWFYLVLENGEFTLTAANFKTRPTPPAN